MHRVAVVDDEKNIRNLIRLALEDDGFAAVEYPNGEEAWKGLSEKMTDIIILDIMMPRMNGLELCRKIRKLSPAVPIIFLSSRDEEYDRVIGLESGADDYVCKPFSMMELTARVRAAARRLDLTADLCGDDCGLEYGPLRICSADLTCEWNGMPVRLSVTEHRILASLAASPGIVKTRGQLMSAAFPDDAYVNEKAADSHIKRIRKKIKEADPSAEVFEAVYGLGYRLRVEL